MVNEMALMHSALWCSAVGLMAWSASALLGVGFLIQDRNLRTGHFGVLFQALPSVSALGTWGRRWMLVGHAALGAALVFWWPAAWGWAEVMALAWWCWSAWVIGEDLGAGWRGRRSVARALVGFAQLAVLVVAWSLSAL